MKIFKYSGIDFHYEGDGESIVIWKAEIPEGIDIFDMLSEEAIDAVAADICDGVVV